MPARNRFLAAQQHDARDAELRQAAMNLHQRMQQVEAFCLAAEKRERVLSQSFWARVRWLFTGKG